VAGYSIKDLFIGSEGTLGVITEILLKLLPRPAARQTILATFDSMADAAETVSDIIAHKIIPCTLEFLDHTTIGCVEAFAKLGLPLDAAAILLMETDGHAAVVAEEAAQMTALAQAHHARDVRQARDAAEAEKLATARRSAFSALARVSRPPSSKTSPSAQRVGRHDHLHQPDRRKIPAAHRHLRPHGRRQPAPDLPL